MAIDRLDWHGESAEQDGFDYENGSTHIGMYLAWVILSGLQGEFHDEESAEELAAVRERRMTGRQFLQDMCDTKFTDEDVNEEAYEFSQYYYDSGKYFADYEAVLVQPRNLSSVYAVDDTWDNYEQIAAVIEQRYRDWQASRA